MNKIKMPILLLLLISIISLTSCSDKTALTNTEFMEKAKSAGFKTENGLDELPDDQQEHYESYTIVTPKDSGYRLEFGVFKQEDTAKNFFENMKSMVESEASKYTSAKTKDLANYQTYRIVSNEIYVVISRVGDTALYGLIPENHKDDVDSFLKDINY